MLSKKEMSELMPGYDYHKPREKKSIKHEESDLQLKFCKWVKREYPEKQFIRHEREKQRSVFMQNLMKVFNTEWDKMPDWEGLFQSSRYDIGEPPLYEYSGLYIEFKKPGEKWLMADGLTIKKQYEYQHKCHLFLWSIGRPAYFCNDLEDAQDIFMKYVIGTPLPKQIYKLNNFSL